MEAPLFAISEPSLQCRLLARNGLTGSLRLCPFLRAELT
jgi:hypothetical protein